MLQYAFSSNAFKKTTLAQAAREIASAGYRGIEVMADVPHAYPPQFGPQQRSEFRSLLSELRLQVSNINAFTLFARGDTYHPTWIERDDAARNLRIEHTIAAIQLAADLGSRTLSIQPGGPMIGTGLTMDQAARRFADGLDAVLPAARQCGITIAIEPEPGLLIQSIEEFINFKKRFFESEPLIAMNCDMGHLFCVGDDPVSIVQRYLPHIAHVHLEDIGQNHVHQHLPLGKGAMDIRGILNALEAHNYQGWVTVELYPYVSTAGDVARKAMQYLQQT
jgi:sugar phosphate isomerase/epimerase